VAVKQIVFNHNTTNNDSKTTTWFTVMKLDVLNLCTTLLD